MIEKKFCKIKKLEQKKLNRKYHFKIVLITVFYIIIRQPDVRRFHVKIGFHI